MDIRDILSQLDSISLREDDEANLVAQQQANKEKLDFVKKQEYLYSLLKQLRALSPQMESNVSISKELVESFGYVTLQEDTALMEMQQLNEAGFVDFIANMGFLGAGIVEPSKGFAARISQIGDKQRQGIYTQAQAEKLATDEVLNYAGIIMTNLGGYKIADVLSSFSKATSFLPIPGWLKIIFGLAGPALKAFGPKLTTRSSPIGKWLAGYIVSNFLSPENQKLIGSTVLGAQDMLKSLAGDISSYDPATTPPEPTTTPTPTTTSPETTTASDQGAKTASSDPEVAKIQKALVAKGAKIKIDGILGPATFRAFDQYGDSLKEFASVSESIQYLRNRLTLIENDPNAVNVFHDEYAFNEEATEESGKKKFISKYPELAKKLGVTITPLEPAAPETPAEPVAPPTAPAPTKPEAPIVTKGGSAKTPTPAARPQTTSSPVADVSAAPFANLDAKSRLDAMSLVKQIKLAIRDMQKVPSSVQGDAKKAIDHAQKTLQIYAPEMV